jgi:hypothetical protein
MAEGTLIVRLKAYDRETGHLVRQITIRDRVYGFVPFDRPGEFVRVPADLGERLRSKTQDPRNPRSPKIFDVMTDEEAQAVDEKERLDRFRAQEAREPTLASARVMDLEEGRGDLRLDDVMNARRAALEAASGKREAAMGNAAIPPEVMRPARPQAPVMEPPAAITEPDLAPSPVPAPAPVVEPVVPAPLVEPPAKAPKAKGKAKGKRSKAKAKK